MLLRPILAALALVTGLSLAATAPASAITFDFNYSGTDVSGSGQFFGDLVSGNQYNLTGITGIANGSNIVSLSASAGADNQLYYPSDPGSLITFAGISFLTSAGINWNLFQWNVDGGPYFTLNDGTCSNGGNPGDSEACPSTPISFNVAAVPVPAGLPLALSALGILGGLVWLQRRKSLSAVALAA